MTCRQQLMATTKNSSLLLVFTFLSAFHLFYSAVASATELKKIHYHNTTGQTSVTLELSDIPRYTTNKLLMQESETVRCYVDLYSTTAGADIPKKQIFADEFTIGLRTGRHGNMLRVVVDLLPDSLCAIDLNEENNRIVFTATKRNLPPKPHTGPMSRNPFEKTLPAFTPEQEKSTSPQLSDAAVDDSTKLQPTDSLATFSGINSLAQESQKNYHVWGWIKGFAASDTRKDNYEDHTLYRTRARLGGDWDKQLDTEDIKLALSADIDHIFYDNDDADEDTDIDLYETYLQWNLSKAELTIGKQRVRWGKGDQLSPLDMINPEDTRQFIGVPLEERKLSSWLLRSRYFMDNVTIEGIIDPWFEKSKVGYLDSDWALYRNLRQAITQNNMVPLPLRQYAQNLDVHERTPDITPENMSAAMRVAWQTNNSDFAVSGRYGWETTPTITSFPVKNINYQGKVDAALLQNLSTAILTDEDIESRYKRQTIIGFEWETVFDRIGFRGEAAFIDKVSFLNSSLTSSRKSASHLVAGIDYTTNNEWYLNLQTSWYKVYGYNGDLLYLSRDNLALLGEISKPFWRGNFEISTKFNYTLTDGSSYLQPALRIKYFKNTEIETGVMIFSGDKDTLLGSYDEADQVYLQAKYSF